MRKEQVQILKRDDETLNISAEEPDIDPIGMGYAGVITSDMFDLNAALDTHTQQLLEEQRKLTIKTLLTKSEGNRLEALSAELETLGFRHQMRDPVFTEYIKARASITADREKTENKERVSSQDARRLVEEALKKNSERGEK